MSGKDNADLVSNFPRPHEQKSPVDVNALRAEYEASALAQEADTFALVRIIGNDLPPRHEIGQGRKNLEFTLENEPEFDQCSKIWVLNRIVEPDELAKLKALLEKHGREYIEIPYIRDEYIRVGWDLDSFGIPNFLESAVFSKLEEAGQATAWDHAYRHKNCYVMNNNGARNAALRLGRQRGKWVLPWDGNCFLTQDAWRAVSAAVCASPYLKYFTVPMARVTSNEELISEGFQPHAVEEPQIIFRRDAREEFSEHYRYGRRPKVELFWRLGINGNWDRWRNHYWDAPFPRLSPDAGCVGQAGWVARLFSGVGALEQDDQASFKNRGIARQSAVRVFLGTLDTKLLGQRVSIDDLLCVNADELSRYRKAWQDNSDTVKPLVKKLLEDADAALQRGRLCVVDKTSLPPSGSSHDYWHPAPYWWPRSDTPDGLPYVRRDGERVPGTKMYEPDSGRYDRTRAQHLFDDTWILALAAYITGESAYGQRAVSNLRVWFLDNATKMTPHLNYSQVRMGHNANNGASTGIIEFKDLYYMLDGVKILRGEGYLDDIASEGMREWFCIYLEWLQTSPQGLRERGARNNHGVLYDLQILAVAHFVGDWAEVTQVIRRAQDRVGDHFAADGSQPHELTRTLTQHYCAFNLQSWANLATALDNVGFDLWNFRSLSGAGLEQGFRWFLSYAGKDWPFLQIEDFDEGRCRPLSVAGASNYIDIDYSGAAHSEDAGCDKPRFWPHDGIRPYWNIG